MQISYYPLCAGEDSCAPLISIWRRIEKILYRVHPGLLVSFQVSENTPTKRLHSVISDFFTSIGFAPMGGIERRYNTRKGKAARLLCEVFSIPPARLKTGISHKGVRPMKTANTAPVTLSLHTNDNPEISIYSNAETFKEFVGGFLHTDILIYFISGEYELKNRGQKTIYFDEQSINEIRSASKLLLDSINKAKVIIRNKVSLVPSPECKSGSKRLSKANAERGAK